MPSPKLLSIVLNYRTPDLSLRAAEAALVAMQGIEGELIIVDNDSGDGSEKRLRAGIATRLESSGWGRVRFLQAGRNGGFGAGNNAGIHAGLSDGSAPDYVYILNPDAAPEPQPEPGPTTVAGRRQEHKLLLEKVFIISACIPHNSIAPIFLAHFLFFCFFLPTAHISASAAAREKTAANSETGNEARRIELSRVTSGKPYHT